jgi:hypothetical protein
MDAGLEQVIRPLFERGRNGAGWFYWVAGLSAVNSIIALSGGNHGFALGLGVTLISDSAAVAGANQGLGWQVTAFAAAFDAIVLGMVVLCGWLSQKRILPIFALGMGLYFLDGRFFLLIMDVMSIAIHGFALWGMISGFNAYRKLNQIERQLAALPPLTQPLASA